MYLQKLSSGDGLYFFKLLGSFNVNFALGNGKKEKIHKLEKL